MDSISFRKAYSDGVPRYYTLNAATYRNPHEPGIVKSLRSILDVLIPRSRPASSPVRIFDLAAGSGEATLAALSFLATHRPALRPGVVVGACDPYTHALYTSRTGLPCAAHSFKDVLTNGLDGAFDVVVCSFALHLCEVGQLWGVLYAVSLAAGWLVVLAPGKGPEVGSGAGWERCGKEVVVERVRGRVYRSLNFAGGKEEGEGEEVGVGGSSGDVVEDSGEGTAQACD